MIRQHNNDVDSLFSRLGSQSGGGDPPEIIALVFVSVLSDRGVGAYYGRKSHQIPMRMSSTLNDLLDKLIDRLIGAERQHIIFVKDRRELADHNVTMGSLAEDSDRKIRHEGKLVQRVLLEAYVDKRSKHTSKSKSKSAPEPTPRVPSPVDHGNATASERRPNTDTVEPSGENGGRSDSNKSVVVRIREYLRAVDGLLNQIQNR